MWEEKTNRNIEITTGDGVVFNCLWTNSEKLLRFNTSVYDFIDKKKTFVDRRNPQSRVIEIVFYFQGEDHIEQSDRFEKSSEDKRYWILNHPIYGIIYGHPMAITFTNEHLNSTKITVDFMETITDEAGISEVEYSQENSTENYNELSDNAADTFENAADLDSQDKKSLMQNIVDASTRYRSLYNSENTQEIQKRIRDVSNSVDKVINVPYSFVKDLYSFVGYASFLNTSVFDKIDFCEQIYSDFKALVTNKKYFEVAGGAAVGAAALSLLNIDSPDNFSRSQLFSLGVRVNTMYNDYMQNIEDNEVNLEDYNNKSIIDFSTQNTLYALVTNAIYRLMTLIYDARQERNIVLEKDSNLIILTHRFLGLDDDDENIELFKSINNIKNQDIFVLKQGTMIKYYV